ncbi:MAG: tRNA (adenosine(37)-N6)-threonylcarbamoyltransferase complex ATPase subunit type 1 TsaE, partial [Hyphomicrobiaceae bacterium]
DLGAGKTTFAKFLIQAYADDPALPVPSPTFTLVERYDLPRGVVHHADLYRIETPGEVDELGIDEALEEGVTLVEWPERASGLLAGNALMITLEAAATADQRSVTLSATPDWKDRLARLKKMSGFLESAVSEDADIRYLQVDASARRYARIVENGRSAILMDSPEQSDGPPVKDGKPYSAIAHLAENVTPFVAVAQALDAAGVRVPRIHAADLKEGFLIIDDLGDRVFGTEIANGADLQSLYSKACDVLLHLRQNEAPEVIELSGGITHRIPAFDQPAFAIETRLLTDWYIPAVTGAPIADAAAETFEAIWQDLYRHVSGHAHWVLRDFHSPNLIHLPGENGLASVGVIDFQDAMRGHAAYDLASLLQDARLDVSPSIEAVLLDRYCTIAGNAPSFDETEFRRAYAIFGAQRNTKILGIFARLAKRDGKSAYLAHIPRIWGYLERNLRHEDLSPLKAWYDTNLPAERRQIP